MVTIVKDTNGKVFGGYTDIEIDGKVEWKNGQKIAFYLLFQTIKLLNANVLIIKMNFYQENQQIC